MLLGGVGPVGLHMAGELPSMRFAPHVLILADAEDFEAHKLCLKLLTELRGEERPAYSDGFFDCSCYDSATKLLLDLHTSFVLCRVMSQPIE